MNEKQQPNALEQLIARGLRLLLDLLFGIGVAGQQHAEQPSVGNGPLVDQHELVDPRDDGQPNEPVAVVHQVEQNVDLAITPRGGADHRVHNRVVRLAAFDLGQKRLQNVVGFLRVSRRERSNHADLAMLVSEKQEQAFHQLGEVFEHVHARLVVQNLPVRGSEGAYGDPGDDEAACVRTAHRYVLLKQGNEDGKVDGFRFRYDLFEKTVENRSAVGEENQSWGWKDIFLTSVSTSENRQQIA